MSFLQVPVPGLVGATAKRKRMLSPEELEDRRNKRQAAAAKRKQLMEEKRRGRAGAQMMLAARGFSVQPASPPPYPQTLPRNLAVCGGREHGCCFR